MIATDILVQLIGLLRDAVSISIELENVIFDPLTNKATVGKAKITIGGTNNGE